MKHLLAVAAMIMPHAAMADNYLQYDAHVHGVGKLNLAISGDQLGVELIAPGADIVGFEYAPTSQLDQQALDAALAKLQDAKNIIIFPAPAQCALGSVAVHVDGAEHEEHEGHEEHEEHENHEEHEGHHGAPQEHASVHAEYLFECQQMHALEGFTLPYFHNFPNALELEVQIVNHNGARAYQVQRDQPTLEL